MKINIKNIIIIMLIFITMEVVYLIGFYTPNKESYSNSETEICAENPSQNSESNSDFENEILDYDTDLTKTNDCVIIITDDEADVNTYEPTHEDIMFAECPFTTIDESYLIDSYEEGNWYCYYLYCDGDVYVVTLKNNHVDICVMLN